MALALFLIGLTVIVSIFCGALALRQHEEVPAVESYKKSSLEQRSFAIPAHQKVREKKIQKEEAVFA